MRLEFDDEDLRRLYEEPAFHLKKIGPELTKAYRKKVGIIVSAEDERDLYAMKSLHLEKLAGDREGQHSIRLNDQWRLILKLNKQPDGTIVAIIEIADYH